MDGALGLSTEQLVGGLYGLLLLGMAAVQVINRRSANPATRNNDPIITGVAGRFGSDLQMERLIEALVDICDAIKAKDIIKQAETTNAQLERLTRQLEQALSKPSAMLGRRRRRAQKQP